MSEIARAWQGAWRLAHADANGLAYFDDTVEAFWRSFRAAAIVAPGYAIFAALHYAARPPEASGGRIFLVEAVLYAVGWLAYPVLMHAVCRLIDREALYLRYITAYNWAAMLQMAFYLCLLLVTIAARLPDGVADFLGGAGFIVVLLYAWIIARIGLRIGAVAAALLVGIDVAIGYGLDRVTELMLY